MHTCCICTCAYKRASVTYVLRRRRRKRRRRGRRRRRSRRRRIYYNRLSISHCYEVKTMRGGGFTRNFLQQT
jgi:hypothetical protein